MFLIIRRKGPDSYVVVPEMYSIQGYVNDDPVELVRKLNEDLRLETYEDDGLPVEEEFDMFDEDTVWYDWKKIGEFKEDERCSRSAANDVRRTLKKYLNIREGGAKIKEAIDADGVIPSSDDVLDLVMDVDESERGLSLELAEKHPHLYRYLDELRKRQQ